jgi:transposase
MWPLLTSSLEGGVICRIAKDLEDGRCAAGGSAHVASRGQVEREFRCPPIGHHAVTIVVPIPRVGCLNGGVIRQVALDFAEPRRSYTKAFARYALELSRLMTIQDSAPHWGVSWDVIQDIVQDDWHRRFARPKVNQVRQIAIDEIRMGAGHRYLTIVLDLERGAVVQVGRGKGGAAREAFWKRRRRSGAKVEAVATDMSPASIEAVRRRVPKATWVFDRFHGMKLFNDQLSERRRPLYRQATAAPRRVLQGVRWLLIQRPENLDEPRGERERLEEALKVNEPLATAYYLTEELRAFWEQDDAAAAPAFWLAWRARADASEIKVRVDLARTLRKHAVGLVAYYDDPISTGPLEGTTNKIKTMQRQADGYRDEEFFHLKILACHESKYALVG